MSVCLIQQLGIFVRSLDLVQVLRTIGSKVGLSASSDFVTIANQPTIPTSASSGLKSCSMILPKKAFTFRRRDRACNKLKLGVSSHLGSLQSSAKSSYNRIAPSSNWSNWFKPELEANYLIKFQARGCTAHSNSTTL